MPDPVQIVEALLAAGASALVVAIACVQPWRSHCLLRTGVGGVLGSGVGFYVGCCLLALIPHWPPREDQDRFLLILFPSVLLVELLAAVRPSPAWLWWLLRALIAAAAAPALLYNSVYLADFTSADRIWTLTQAWLVLGGLAAALCLVWASLGYLSKRSPGRSLTVAMAAACGGAAATVMLSGYASGGQIGLVLAAAVLGTAAGFLFGPPQMNGVLGLAVVGLFTLVVIGRFFGELSTVNAGLLLCSPLLAWLVELPGVRKARPRIRGFLTIIFVAVPLAFAVTSAQRQFTASSAKGSQGSEESPADDYSHFGDR